MPIALPTTIGANTENIAVPKCKPTIATSLRFIDVPTPKYRSETLVSQVMNGVVDGNIVFAPDRYRSH